MESYFCFCKKPAAAMKAQRLDDFLRRGSKGMQWPCG
jgi:hypothetical protein